MSNIIQETVEIGQALTKEAIKICKENGLLPLHLHLKDVIAILERLWHKFVDRAAEKLAERADKPPKAVKINASTVEVNTTAKGGNA